MDSVAVLMLGALRNIRHITACLAKVPHYHIPVFLAQIHKHTIEVWHVFLSKKICTQISHIVAFFLMYVRPPLYSFDLTQPLSCLGSSVVRASP